MKAMRRCSVLILASALALPLAAQAATQQKAGLWASTVKINMGGGFPQIDPAMQAQMEAAGIQLPFVKPVTTNVCLTEEQVSMQALPNFNDPDSGCSSKNVKRDGDRVTGDLECNGSIQGKGDIQMALNGAESYRGVSNFSGNAEGMPVSMKTEFSGKWLGADCGTVAPLEMPSK